MYQAFVAALLEGGGAALRRDLGELHALVAAAREQSIWENAAADRVKNRENGVVAEAMQLHMQASRLFENPRLPGRGERIGSLPTAEQLQSTLTAREQGARDRAADWARQADDLEAMCQLLEKVHQERKQILRAPKQRSLLEAIRRKFS